MIRCIVADDHPIVINGVRQLLLSEFPTAEIAEVHDSESLVRKVIKERWDLVITDLNMPGRSGLDALAEIRNEYPKLPVLVMSMFPEDQYALRVMKAGASGYLVKTSIHEELINAVRTVLGGRKFITSSIAQKLADSLQHNTQVPHELLSNREYDVFILLAQGTNVSEIATKINLSPTTISTYRGRIMEKMNLKSNADLTRYALERNLI